KANQRSQTKPASITFDDQQLSRVDGSPALTVKNATLPKGGFVVVHNESYEPPNGDPFGSAIGISEYLKSGTHQNVEVQLVIGSVKSTQKLVSVPYLDTNGNQTYDYVRSGGETDYAYLNRESSQSSIPNDTATISVKETDRTGTKAETTASMGGSTATPTDATTTPINTSTPCRVTNLSVSNQSVHVGDEVTVTAWIKNPTGSRLEDDLALATAGEAVETQQVALFASESRAVTFTHTYGAP